jgi:DNA-3-methyladenine glycosylase
VPAGGVLIRAIEPIMGIGQKTDGPGKLTKALSITREQGGIDATVPGALYVGQGVEYDPSDIIATPRIGISVEQDRLWRFYVRNNRGRGA